MTLLLAIDCGRAQESQPSEYQIKAAFLFNFAKFVEWPTEAFDATNSPLIIGVIGDNPFSDDLKNTIRNKTVNNRPLEVKVFTSLPEAKKCHILFICTSEKKRFGEIFEALRGTNILTVSETDTFIQAGGMINFIVEGGKIRFQINDDTAKKASLKISSKLLSLAVRPAR